MNETKPKPAMIRVHAVKDGDARHLFLDAMDAASFARDAGLSRGSVYRTYATAEAIERNVRRWS